MEAPAIARLGRRFITRGARRLGFGAGGAPPHSHHGADTLEEDARDLFSYAEDLLGIGEGAPHRVPANRIARAAAILPSEIFARTSKIRRGSSNLRELNAMAKLVQPQRLVGGVALPKRIAGKDTDVQVVASMVKHKAKKNRSRIHIRSQSMGSVPFAQVASSAAGASATAGRSPLSLFRRPGPPPFRAVIFTDEAEKGGGAVINPSAFLSAGGAGGGGGSGTAGRNRIQRYQTAPPRAFATYLNPFDEFLSGGSAGAAGAAGGSS